MSFSERGSRATQSTSTSEIHPQTHYDILNYLARELFKCTRGRPEGHFVELQPVDGKKEYTPQNYSDLLDQFMNAWEAYSARQKAASTREISIDNHKLKALTPVVSPSPKHAAAELNSIDDWYKYLNTNFEAFPVARTLLYIMERGACWARQHNIFLISDRFNYFISIQMLQIFPLKLEKEEVSLTTKKFTFAMSGMSEVPQLKDEKNNKVKTIKAKFFFLSDNWEQSLVLALNGRIKLSAQTPSLSATARRLPGSSRQHTPSLLPHPEEISEIPILAPETDVLPASLSDIASTTSGPDTPYLMPGYTDESPKKEDKAPIVLPVLHLPPPSSETETIVILENQRDFDLAAIGMVNMFALVMNDMKKNSSKSDVKFFTPESKKISDITALAQANLQRLQVSTEQSPFFYYKKMLSDIVNFWNPIKLAYAQETDIVKYVKEKGTRYEKSIGFLLEIMMLWRSQLLEIAKDPAIVIPVPEDFLEMSGMKHREDFYFVGKKFCSPEMLVSLSLGVWKPKVESCSSCVIL